MSEYSAAKTKVSGYNPPNHAPNMTVDNAASMILSLVPHGALEARVLLLKNPKIRDGGNLSLPNANEFLKCYGIAKEVFKDKLEPADHAIAAILYLAEEDDKNAKNAIEEAVRSVCLFSNAGKKPDIEVLPATDSYKVYVSEGLTISYIFRILGSLLDQRGAFNLANPRREPGN